MNTSLLVGERVGRTAETKTDYGEGGVDREDYEKLLMDKLMEEICELAEGEEVLSNDCNMY